MTSPGQIQNPFFDIPLTFILLDKMFAILNLFGLFIMQYCYLECWQSLSDQEQNILHLYCTAHMTKICRKDSIKYWKDSTWKRCFHNFDRYCTYLIILTTKYGLKMQLFHLIFSLRCKKLIARILFLWQRYVISLYFSWRGGAKTALSDRHMFQFCLQF